MMKISSEKFYAVEKELPRKKNTHKYFSFKRPENDVFSIYQILFPWKKLQNKKYVSVKQIMTRASTYLKYFKEKCFPCRKEKHYSQLT